MSPSTRLAARPPAPDCAPCFLHRAPRALRALLAAALGLCAGCGPIAATSRILAADVEVHRAHAADGEQHAPYEMTSADLYLAKAREEQGYARYAAAAALADRSVAFAKAAVLKAAVERTGAPSGAAAPLPGGVVDAPVRPRSREPIQPEGTR